MTARAHILFKCPGSQHLECKAPSDGTDCLACSLPHCTVCLGCEGELPTHCPGAPMDAARKDAVMAGKAEYHAGIWYLDATGHAALMAIVHALRDGIALASPLHGLLVREMTRFYELKQLRRGVTKGTWSVDDDRVPGDAPEDIDWRVEIKHADNCVSEAPASEADARFIYACWWHLR